MAAAKKATRKKAATKKKAPAKRTPAKRAPAKKASRRAPAKKAPQGKLVVASKVKEQARAAGASQVPGDFVDAVNNEVVALIKQAVKRAKDNNRKSPRSYDL